MRKFVCILPVVLLLTGCLPRGVVLHPGLPQTPLQKDTFDAWEGISYEEALALFRADCRSGKSRKLYGGLCDEAQAVEDAGAFFRRAFVPYRIVRENGGREGLLTGYYEPLLHGSRNRTERYRYPIYREPDDLISIELSSLYPDLKGKTLRGRLEGKKLIPYLPRSRMHESSAEVICWVDDRVERFFLEVQGSGRVELEEGGTIFVGYANQNGHPYRSIGKYLIGIGEIPQENISLEAIRRWLHGNPQRIDEVLYHNPSTVFFREKTHAASGALGLELTPKRSLAVDPRYIPLGAMLYMHTSDPLSGETVGDIVFAQDTGGAIKGTLRADLFCGYGEEAELRAGSMKERLALWILLPK